MRKTLFRELAEVFQKLEKTSSSLAMREILADFFGKIDPQEAKMTAYLLQGRVAPEFEGLELGLAEKLVQRSIAKAGDISLSKVESLFKKTGDLGKVVEEIKEKSQKKAEDLSIEDVFETLKLIAKTAGEGSQEQKLSLLSNLISKVSPLEARYIVRIVLRRLRLGVAEMTFLYGLAKAYTLSYQNKEKLEKCFNVISDLGEVAYLAAKYGLKGLENVKPKPGVPIRMMLAQRIYEVEEVKDHISGRVIVEYKYDGERVQAHILGKDKVILFSRRHENITHQYPDLIEAVKEAFKGKTAIVEGEAVAVEAKSGKLQSFQTLMKRRRKYQVSLFAKEIPAVYYLFDILYLDGKSLLAEPLEKRKEVLQKCFSPSPKLQFSKHLVTEDSGEIESFFLEAVNWGAEGVMIKDSKGIYQAGTRGWLWIKFKKDYREEMADTFDLVVMGALLGRGKRAGSYGSLLVAAFDPETNKYYSFTKVGAGFTDEDLANLPKILDKYKIAQKHRLLETEMKMDVWFEPRVVIEISGAEMTISPVHTVAKDVLKKGGLALRFPRFLRFRNDKKPEQATTVSEILDLWRRLKEKSNGREKS